MVDHWLLRWLLLPFALLFGLAVSLKNLLYRYNVLNSVQFNIPVIAVGNLSVGGAGKTPHVEYLLRLLKPYLRTGVMSRGYGRKTSGFLAVTPQLQSDQSGDEPLLYARKFKDVAVAVSESRSVGIPLLLQEHPYTQVLILDDAYQHRSVKPFVNILLTEYALPYCVDWLLPFGRLREWRSAASRADIIVVTKCPPSLDIGGRQEMHSQLSPLPHQTVYFSSYQYHQPYSVYRPYNRIELTDLESALIVCGIARPEGLVDYIADTIESVDMLVFKDHHDYQQGDVELMARRFDQLPGTRRALLTTEKDIVRLEAFGSFFASRNLPLYIVPIEVSFLFDDGPQFDAHIQRLLLDFRI